MKNFNIIIKNLDYYNRCYPKILQALSVAISKEKHALTLDNICGAIARMIEVNTVAIPMDEVFPVFVQHLPLREDFDENEAVFRCFSCLYQQGHQQLVKHLPNIINMSIGVLHNKQTTNKGKCLWIIFIYTVCTKKIVCK